MNTKKIKKIKIKRKRKNTNIAVPVGKKIEREMKEEGGTAQDPAPTKKKNQELSRSDKCMTEL